MHLVGIKEVNEGNENYCGWTIWTSKWINLLYQEKLRMVREALRPVKKSHLNHHDPFLGCGGKDRERHV